MSKIIKFGGKSLSNGKGIEQALSIIQDKLKNREKIVVTLSARGNATNELENILELAKEGKPYEADLNEFKAYQKEPLNAVDHDFTKEFELLDNLIEGVKFGKGLQLKNQGFGFGAR